MMLDRHNSMLNELLACVGCGHEQQVRVVIMLSLL